MSILSGVNNGFGNGLNNALGPRLSNLLELDNTKVGILVSFYYLGAILGCILGSSSNYTYGRKRTTLWGEIIIIIGSLGQICLLDFWSIVCFRLISGVGIGICAVTKPLYVAELSPPKVRGIAGTAFAIAFSAGINIVLLLEALLPDEKLNSSSTNRFSLFGYIWHFEVFLSTIPPVFLILLIVYVMPKSPIWLELRKRRQNKKVEEQQALIKNVRLEEQKISSKWLGDGDFETAEKSALRKARITLLILNILYMYTGMVIIMNFAAEICVRIYVPDESAKSLAFLFGVIHIIGVSCSVFFIDSFGRRPLLLGGTTVHSLCAFALAALGYMNFRVWQINFAILMVYVFSFQIGVAATYWTLISEFYPLNYREEGNMFGALYTMINAVIISLIYPITRDVISIGTLFLVAGFIASVPAIGLYFLLPETKGVPVDQVTLMWQRWNKTK
eukprot:g6361.t1